jgi:hypothetical protein
MKYNPFQATGRYKVTEHGSEIKPPRYIYHLDYSGGRYYLDSESLNYKRMNIAKEGLFGKDMGNGGVWANVYQRNPYGWFPICLDLYDCRDALSAEMLIGYYDVWRIDTTKIKNIWYNDEKLMEGEVNYLSKALYTPDTVSGKALQLFHMDLDKDMLYDYKVNWLAPLIPMKTINNYIRFTHRRRRIYLN